MYLFINSRLSILYAIDCETLSLVPSSEMNAQFLTYN